MSKWVYVMLWLIIPSFSHGHGARDAFEKGFHLSVHHRFQEALTVLERAVARRPDHGAAWLQIASISLVIGDVERAIQACNRSASSVDPVAVLACKGRVAINLGDVQGYPRLREALALPHYQERQDAYVLWAVAVAAELAVLAGDDRNAEVLFKRYLKYGKSAQVTVAFADFLLERQRPDEVLTLDLSTGLATHLRWIMAHLMMGHEDLVEDDIHRLDENFRRAIHQGDFEHGREMAQFYLGIRPVPRLAALAAEKNLERQQEPEDLEIFRLAGASEHEAGT